MINPSDLRMLVIRPTLQHIGLWSQAAENLLVGTWFCESTIGHITHLKQVKGPALGGYGIEPFTHQDHYKHFFCYFNHLGLRDAILSLVSESGFDDLGKVNDNELIGNLPYATAIARIKYYRDKEPLPSAGDLLALGKYYKRVFNTESGKGSAEKFVSMYPG